MKLMQNKSRTHYSQLADGKEVDEMLKKEAQRSPVKEKQTIHYPDFKTLLEWLHHLNLPVEFLTQENISAYDVLKSAEKIKPLLISKTLELVKSKDVGIQAILENVTKYLGEEDTPEKSDFILVFGSTDLGRVEKAVELYKQGISKLLVITGGQPHYEDDRLPEAVVFSRYAIKLGIPKDSILVEPNSINFADNAKAVFNLLDNLRCEYKKVTTVTAWFSHRRIWAHLMKLSPANTTFYRVNTTLDSGRLTEHEWFNNELGLGVIFNEFVKMKVPIVLNNTA